MAQRIIIEGPDGAGKSTLVNRVRDWINPAMVVAWTKPAGDTPEERKDYTLSSMWPAMTQFPQIMNQTNIIYDRSHVSQLVYGSVFDGVDYIPTFEHCIDLTLPFEWKYIFMRVSTEELIRRIAERGDWNTVDLERENAIENLNLAYQTVISWFEEFHPEVKVFVYEWRNDISFMAHQDSALKAFVKDDYVG